METPDPTMLYEMDDVIMKDIENSTNFIEEPFWLTLIVTIMGLVFLGSCIIPHSMIIRRIGNSDLYKTKNFYFVLVHLSWGSLLQMIYSVYLSFVTDEYLADPKTSVFLIFHIATTQTQIQHALFFTIDKFVNSKKFCRRTIKNNWTMHAFGILVMTILLMHDIASMYAILNGLIIISTIVFAIYIVRFVIYLVKGSDEEKYNIRLAISGLCIVSNYGYAVWAILENFCDINSLIIFNGVCVVVHASGWFSLILLSCYDTNIDLRFKFGHLRAKLKSKLLKCCKTKTDGASLDMEGRESRQDTTLSMDEHSVCVGTVSPAFIADHAHEHKTDLGTITIGHAVDCKCIDCDFRNQASTFRTRNSKEDNVSII